MFRLRSPVLRGAITGVVCAAICWGLSLLPWLQALENWSADTCFVWRGKRPSSAPILIIGLDDASLGELGKPLMFLSPELAKVVQFVSEHHAAAIGIDLLFPQPAVTIEDLLPPDGPGNVETMGRAVSQAGNVVLPLWLLPDQPPIEPIYEWQAALPAWYHLGFVNLSNDQDSYVRGLTLQQADHLGAAHPCFPLAVLAAARSLPREWFAQSELSLDGRPIPLDARGRLTINYVGPPGAIPRVSFRDALAAAESGGSIGYDLENAIVLIGAVLTEQDRHATPYLNQSLARSLQLSWLGGRAELMPGIEVHANVLATLWDGAFIVTPWWLAAPLLLAAAGAALGAALARMSLAWGALLTLAHHCGWRVLCVGAFWCCGWRVTMAPMFLLGLLAYGAVFAMRWRWMRRMLGLVKSEAVAQVLEADPGSLDLKGQEREITVLFSDIRGFTPFSEQHTPQQVVELLNHFFSAVVPIMEAHGGTVNQYIGDAVMIIFGAPKRQEDHALRAVLAAEEMARRMRQLRGKWRQLGAEQLHFGIGIHTGSAVVGTIGSPRRLDYTAIGDTVNTAARIESANKELNTEILVSHATWSAIPPGARRRLFQDRQPLSLSVKGKREPLSLFALDVDDDGEAAADSETDPAASGTSVVARAASKRENQTCDDT